MPDLLKIVWPDATETLGLTPKGVGELVQDALSMGRDNRPQVIIILPYTE